MLLARRRCWLPLHARGLQTSEILRPEKPFDPWKEDAVRACLAAIRSGRTRIALQVAQDYRRVLAELMSRLFETRQAKKILFVGLTEQDKMSGMLQRHHPTLTTAIHKKTPRKPQNADIYLTTYNSITKDYRKTNKQERDKAKGIPVKSKEKVIPQYDASKVDVMILNEADQWKKISTYEVILSHIGSPKRSRPPVIISFSSTNDLNALRLVDFAGDVVYQRFYLDDLQDTWECPSLFYASPAPLGLRKKPVERGASFSPGGVSKIMNKPHVIKQVVQEWQNRASTRKSTLVYCHDDTHVKKLAKAFRELGIDARHLTSEEITATEGELCIKYRGEIAAFRAGQFPMLLVAHDRFYDLPNTDCIVLAAPHVDRSKLALRLATGMKASPQTSKENCLVIDILDGNHQLSPAYSICSLFQLEPHEVDGKPPNVLQEIARKKAQLALDSIPPPSEVKGPKLNPVELLPIENDEVLLRQAEQEKTDVALGALHGSSTRRRWVLCAPGIYVHDGMDRGHAILRQVNIEGEPRYEVYWTNRRLMEGAPKEGGAEDVLKLSTPEDLETTLKMLKQVLPLRAPERPKYRKFKPSDEQLDALKSMWPQNLDPINRVLFDGKPMERDAFFDWLSVGDVSDAMARLRYGKGPDITPFSYSNLTAIVGRILANKPPGEENMKKKAKELARWELKKAKSERKAEIDELLRQRRLEAQPL